MPDKGVYTVQSANIFKRSKRRRMMEDTTRFVKVFVPYNTYNHVAYYFYYTDELGELPFGTFVRTSLGLGVIIKENIPETELPNIDIRCIECLATEKEEKKIKKDWWNTILDIHQSLKHINK